MTLNQKKKSQVYKIPEVLQRIAGKKDVKVLDEYYNLETTKVIRSLVVQFIDQQLNANIEASEKKGSYKECNWELSQADDIGFRRAYRSIRRLLEV